MPQRGPKPSEIAVEAKRYYIPKIERCLPDIPARSFAYSEVTSVNPISKQEKNQRLRIAVLDADAVDVALQWNYEDNRYEAQNLNYTVPFDRLRIPLILPVDEKRAGGDWESSSMAPEENLSRRSNFVRCLARARISPTDVQTHPIPSRGGIYSPQVVIFRSGSKDNHTAWDISRWTWLPVISVAPGRRPKLKATATAAGITTSADLPDHSDQDFNYEYTFVAERELMLEKIRTALRLAATWHHRDIVVGPFGCGPGFRNPARQLSGMWKRVLFEEEEFCGVFDNVVFAIEHVVPAIPSLASSNTNGTIITAAAVTSADTEGGSAGTNGNGPTNANAARGSNTMSDYEIFKEEFEPKRVCKISYCKKT